MHASPASPTAILCLAFAACSGGIVEDTTPRPDGPNTTGPTTDTADTADTGSPPPGVVDCSAIPAMPEPALRLDAPSGYNDLVFDADGGMLGNDGNHLIRATSPDAASVFAPNTGTIYKLGLLPSGDYVATTDQKTVLRINADGEQSMLATDLNGYGLAVGSDGMVYVSTNYNASESFIRRIDPDTGEVTPYLDFDTIAPRAIEFSRDYSRLYIGTLGGGQVLAVDLDADLNPIGEPQRVVTLPSAWHDTLEVDACGNLYVGGFYEWTIYRVSSADLEITALMSWNFNNYGHGLEWGSGIGPWNELAIYVTHPYNGTWVDEHVIGVPSRSWPGEVIGGATL